MILAKLFMWLQQLFFRPKNPGAHTGTMVRTILKNEGVKDIFVSDVRYRFTSKKDIVAFLKTDLVNLRTYVPEKYDCDNFSFALMGAATNLLSGHAFGIVWAKTPAGGHALNFFIDEDGEFWYVEPQNDKIFQEAKYKPYMAIL